MYFPTGKYLNTHKLYVFIMLSHRKIEFKSLNLLFAVSTHVRTPRELGGDWGFMVCYYGIARRGKRILLSLIVVESFPLDSSA